MFRSIQCRRFQPSPQASNVVSTRHSRVFVWKCLSKENSMKKFQVLALSAGLASVALLGLQLTQAQTKTLVIGMAQANNAEPWREAMNSQLTSAAKKMNMQLTIADARQDNSK